MLSCNRIIALAAVLCLAACGIRQIENPDGSQAVELFLSVAIYTECDGRHSRLIDQTFVGVWKDASTVGVGFKTDQLACLTPDCQVVFWLKDNGQIAEMRTLFEAVEDPCFVN